MQALKPSVTSAAEALPSLPAAAQSPRTAFQPEKVALIGLSQDPISAAKGQPSASAQATGRSNVLYAVIALLAELDDSSLHIVHAEVIVLKLLPALLARPVAPLGRLSVCLACP